MSTSVERVQIGDVPWDELAGLPGRTVFQDRAWLGFLAETQQAEPVVAVLAEDGQPMGWFTGGLVRRFGVRALGSPLRGWTTSYQGLCGVPDGADRRGLLDAVARWAFAELGCRHVEVLDRGLSPADLTGTPWLVEPLPGWELSLVPSEDDLLAATSSSCRWAIRKAGRNGLVARAADPATFPATFARLLADVTERRGAGPAYGEARVRALVDHLVPAEQIELVEVCREDGEVVAAGAFPGGFGLAAYWGGASRADSLGLLPNELLLWTALTRWRTRGADRFDFGGGGEFKAKFGGTPIEVAWARRSRPASLERLRGAAAAVSRRRAGRA